MLYPLEVSCYTNETAPQEQVPESPEQPTQGRARENQERGAELQSRESEEEDSELRSYKTNIKFIICILNIEQFFCETIFSELFNLLFFDI